MLCAQDALRLDPGPRHRSAWSDRRSCLNAGPAPPVDPLASLPVLVMTSRKQHPLVARLRRAGFAGARSLEAEDLRNASSERLRALHRAGAVSYTHLTLPTILLV